MIDFIVGWQHNKSYATKRYHMDHRKVLARTKEVFGLAESLYKVDMSGVYVQFDLVGRDAGQAGVLDDIFFIRFNSDMLRRSAATHVHDESVPHEVAHIVCFKIPELGSGHNEGWVSVCKSLGGVGTTMHNEEIVYGKGATYEYITTTGAKVRVSQQIHKRVMAGHTYTFGRGQGFICKGCEYSIVGVRGKTFVTPVVNPPADFRPETSWGTI